MTSTPDGPSDDDLVRAALDGEVRAFEVLVVRHEAAVLRVLRLLGIAAGDREDVAQDTFLRVFRHMRSYKPGRSFSGWLYRVTVNAAHDWRDRSQRLAREEVPWGEEAELAPDPGGSADPERAALAKRLEAALELLSERERAVFVLKELEGLDTKAVGQALGITSITVRRHLTLARNRLRKALGD